MKNYVVANGTQSHDCGITSKEIVTAQGCFPVLGKFKTRREALAFGEANLGYGWSVYKRSSQRWVGGRHF